MKFNFIRLISILLTMMLLFTAMPISVGAASLPIAVSDSYKGSSYYQAACNAYSGNSDPRIRFVQVALSQKGYKGGTKSGEWAGNGGGGRYTEYGRFMGKDGLDWCASFVSWCAAAAGIPTNVISRSAGAGHWRSVNTGTYTPIWSNNYTTYNPYKPQVGDLCLYMPYCKSCYKHYNSQSPTAHVVIVASVSSSQNTNGSWSFTTIERGNNNTVESHTINTKMTRSASATCTCGNQPAGTKAYVVQGFFRPNWSLMGGTSVNTVTNALITLTPATQSAYVAKEFVAETNACVVTQITKPTGTKVTQCGLVLMDENGNVLKNYSENISNVGKNTTLFHSWYDINKEVGYTLSKGTTYKYKFFTVVDGVRYEGGVRSFTTKGEVYNNLYFNANGGSCSMSSKQIKKNALIGTLPTPVRNGYEFAGWYTKTSGGMRITEATHHSGGDFTVYAMWTKVKTYTVGYSGNGGSGSMSNTVYQHGDTLTVKDCAFAYSGKEFYKWVLYRGADNTYLSENNTWKTYDEFVASGENLKIFDPGNKITMNEEWTAGCNEETAFYFVAVWTDAEEQEDEVVIKLYIDNSKMYVNGKSVSIDNQGTAPCIINGRTMVPIRAVIEAMGGTVGWNQNLKQVTLKLNGKTLYLRIGENYAFDDNNTYKLDSAAVNINGRTLLPVRAVVEYFGGSVGWNNSERCVTITYSK